MPYGCVAEFVVGSLTCSMTTSFPGSSPTLSLSLHRDGYLRGPWEWGWFPERFTSSTPVFQIPVDQEWQAKNGYVIALLLSHHYIYYWGGCVLPTVFPVTLTKSKSALLKIAKYANKWKNTKPKCWLFLRLVVGCWLFLRLSANTFCYFFFSICKVYNVLSYSCSGQRKLWNSMYI